jgi:hypothetical protein
VSGFDRQFALDVVRRETIRALGLVRAPKPESVTCDDVSPADGSPDVITVRLRYYGRSYETSLSLSMPVAEVHERIAVPAARSLFSAEAIRAPASDGAASALEVIARRLAAAQGHDPDALVLVGQPLRGPHGAIVVSGVLTRPIWHLFAKDVRAVLGALKDLPEDLAITVGDAINCAPQTAVQAAREVIAVLVDAALKE